MATGSAAQRTASQKPAPHASKPPVRPVAKRPAARRKDPTEPRSLGFYLLYAFVLHALFFGLAAFKKYSASLVQLDEIPVDLMMGVEQPAQKPEGGGEDKDEDPEQTPPPPQPQAKYVPPEKVDVAPQPTEKVETTSAAEAIEQVKPPDPEPQPTVTQPTPTISVAAAASRAAGRGGNFGVGPGRGGGRGGLGEGFGVQDKDLPVVSGGAVFGSSKKGALKGELCFIPVSTRRLSDVPRCKPEGIMYASQLNVSPRRFTSGFPGVSARFEWFALDFKGKFSVSKEGEYKFRLHSDDGAILWINGEKVIDNDGQHPPLSKMGSIQLTEGKHRIRVLYFQGPRTMVALQLFVTVPDETERLWSPKL